MFRRTLVLACAVEGEAERRVRGGKAGVAPERLLEGRARDALVALLVGGQPLDVRLLGARGSLRVGQWARGRLEVGVAVGGRVGAVLQQLPAVLRLQRDDERLARGVGRNV